MTILVTGSRGFIGQSLVASFNSKYSIKTISLREYDERKVNLDNVRAVVHLAGVAHKMNQMRPEEYFEINRDLTLRFANQAKTSGVQHFVFISSTKVYGEKKHHFNEFSECLPDDPYGQSKLEAEIELKKIESVSFKVAIIRPPLVYGAHVKGNLLKLMFLISKFKIIPLGGINNQRSMVYLGNLVALIEHVVLNQSSGTFLAGDNKPYSTSDLVRSISNALNSENRIVSLPNFVRKIIRAVKPQLGIRLFDSLVFENEETNRKINFNPPYSFQQGIEEMVNAFQTNIKN